MISKHLDSELRNILFYSLIIFLVGLGATQLPGGGFGQKSRLSIWVEMACIVQLPVLATILSILNWLKTKKDNL